MATYTPKQIGTMLLYKKLHVTAATAIVAFSSVSWVYSPDLLHFLQHFYRPNAFLVIESPLNYFLSIM